MSACPIFNGRQLRWKLLQHGIHVDLKLWMLVVVRVRLEPKLVSESA